MKPKVAKTAVPKQPKQRIIICMGGGGIASVESVPGVEVEIRDYDVPDDWEGAKKDKHGRFESILFSDKGKRKNR